MGDTELAETDAEVRYAPFYYRYERWILPLLVLFSTMLMIADLSF